MTDVWSSAIRLHNGRAVYLLMLTRSWRISSEVVITRELAWKPRSAMIMLVNCWARSTFEPSRKPVAIWPRPPLSGTPMLA